ncbi:MAG: class D beta-lactamase [Cyanobacteria bacterium SZAS-4]|nr:class D beta-lactamase [Cyanobacteria bacterium SZAS-4]
MLTYVSDGIKRNFFGVLVFMSFLLHSQSGAIALESSFTVESIKPYFHGYTASMVVLDLKSGTVFKYNPQICDQRLSPCSTFKIFNSLAGLERGVVADENQYFKWDGTINSRSECNRDQTLQTAVSNSVVWCFQQVAAGVGEEPMKAFLKAEHYGNQDISGGITKFWLGNSLKISANEQVEFLKDLVTDKLSFSKRSMAIVRGLIRLESTDHGVLYGKTGSDMVNGKTTLGWFVGYVVHPDQIYVFAANTQAEDKATGLRTKEIVRQILIDKKLL